MGLKLCSVDSDSSGPVCAVDTHENSATMSLYGYVLALVCGRG
jgi:hypothetical protein